ncbi:MAG: relaxase domain-containing protein [Nibricoccus sp.]
MGVHADAVKTVLHEIERYAETRVRGGNVCKDRLTGNVVAATFMHETSRELDPLIHTHCIVFNTTFDTSEARWKPPGVQVVVVAAEICF